MHENVTNFLINENRGSPKFWAKLADGSCMYGSLVRGSICRSARGAAPIEKTRKGYKHVFIPAGLNDWDIERFVAMASRKAPPLGLKCRDLARQCMKTGIVLSGTLISRIASEAIFDASEIPPPTDGCRGEVEIEVFSKKFDLSSQDFSF